MGFNPHDFMVEWQGTIQKTTARIFYHLFVKKIKADMPCVILITGKSGRGKSSVALHLADILFQEEGLDFAQYVDKAVVGSIKDFGPKTKAILQLKELKDCFVLIIDEARATVNSSDWASLINRTVAMVNALSRAVKPLMIIIVAQSLKDVDRATRDTIDYYIKVTRTYGHPAKIKIYEFYVDDKDVDKPKTKKKLVRGLITDGAKKDTIELTKIAFPRVRDEVWIPYKKAMIESKNELLEAEFDKLSQALIDKNEDGHKERVNNLVNFLWSNKYILNNFAKFTRGKWNLKADFVQNFMVNDSEKKEIEKLLKGKVNEEKEELDFKPLVEDDLNEGVQE
ncbi:MAG TPA: AAA family ATPase [Candidatus Cloacimonas acidaminovorans]|nr:AAA family ATPase [Candidatus Cloacimonas acidaminovorans]